MREKRQHPRATLATLVEIYSVLSTDPVSDPEANSSGTPSSPPLLDEDSKFVAESRDISIGGMFLAGKAPHPVGTELALMFDLPGLGRTQVPGFVRWHRADGFGVQFGLLGPRETHAIGRLLRKEQSY